MKLFALVAVVGLAVGFLAAEPLHAYFSSTAVSTDNVVTAALAFPLVEDFQAFNGWTYAASTPYPPPVGRLNVDGAFAVSNGFLAVDNFGTGGDGTGPIALKPLGFDVAPTDDFELNVALDSGLVGNIEVRVSLVSATGAHAGGVSWISDCGDGTGAIDFHTESAAFDGAYTGCGGTLASFAGTLTLRRVGTTWTGFVDGVETATTTALPTETATQVEVVMTLPSGVARTALVDLVEVERL